MLAFPAQSHAKCEDLLKIINKNIANNQICTQKIKEYKEITSYAGEMLETSQDTENKYYYYNENGKLHTFFHDNKGAYQVEPSLYFA